MAYGEPTTKKFKHSIISERIFEPEFQEIFCKHWHGRTPFKNSDIEIIAEPFRVCRISNFLKSEDFMDELKNELIDVKTRRNCIDLYQFEQSNDLSTVDSNNIKTLYNTFQRNLSDWLQKNTNIVLNNTVSMTSSCYCDTDYLLCHDDNLGNRRIAFILYLSKNWTEEDGGALDLFDTDEDGLPRDVVKSIVPEYNSLVLFEVVHNSYHQVAEVTSPEKSRWSINGWFYGPLVLPDKVQRPKPVINYVEPDNTEVDLSQWVSGNYLYPGIMKEIHEDVEQESYTFLSSFLEKSVYERLTQELQCNDIKWRRVGPADVRNYEVADEDSLPEILVDFCRIFKSITLFQLLKNYTELDLVPVAEHMNPRVTIELQRWSSGCYTLINKFGNEDNADTTASSDKRTSDSRSTSRCENEAVLGGESSSPPKATLPRLQHNIEEYEASEKNLQEDTGCNTPPISTGDDEFEEEEEEEAAAAARSRAKDKSPRKKRSAQQLSPLKDEGDRERRHSDSGDRERRHSDSGDRERRLSDSGDDSDDSDVSDIGDYLSDAPDASFEGSEQEDEGAGPGPEQGQGPAPLIEEVEATEAVEAAEAAEAAEPGALDVIIQFNTQHLEKESIDYVDPREEDAALIHVPPKDNHLCLIYRTGNTCRVHRYVNHYVRGHYYNLVCTYLE